MPCHPDQVGLQPLGAYKIKTLGNDAHSTLDLKTIGPATLTRPWLSGKVSMHQADETLPMHIQHLLHFIDHTSPLSSICLQIQWLHLSEVLSTPIDSHLLVCGHDSLGNIYI
jgi:hypothetical protein